MSDQTYGLFDNGSNRRLIERFREQNVDMFLVPTVEATPLPVREVPAIAQFDWLIFPDLRTVDHFLELFSDKFILDDLIICAGGEAVADKLRFSQLHADVIPLKHNADAMFAAIGEYASPNGVNFILPGEKNSSYKIVPLLEEAGGKVMEFPVYEYRNPVDLTKLRSMMLGGAVDEFIFGSPDDVLDLAALIEPRDIPMRCKALNEHTLQTLREFDIDAVMQK
jgi:uroporphyrinogen-III synthase